jgi:hypothetical protein
MAILVLFAIVWVFLDLMAGYDRAMLRRRGDKSALVK